MAFPTGKLMELANRLADQKQNSIAGIEKEIAEIEARKLEKERALDAARLSHQRASKFGDVLRSGMVCPRCWIETEAISRLHPRPGTDTYDVWKCSHCGFEFHDEFRK